MNYNKKKHLDLLKLSQTLQKIGKDLRNVSKKKFYQLRDYSIILHDTLHFETRNQYFELLEKFLNKSISFVELQDKIEVVNNLEKYLEKEQILFALNMEAKKFGLQIDDLNLVFDTFCPCSEIREEYDLDETQFRNLVGNIYLELKKNYPLDN